MPKEIFIITKPSNSNSSFYSATQMKEDRKLREQCKSDLIDFITKCGYKVKWGKHDWLVFRSKYEERIHFDLGKTFLTIKNRLYGAKAKKMQLSYNKKLDFNECKEKLDVILHSILQDEASTRSKHSVEDRLSSIADLMIKDLMIKDLMKEKIDISYYITDNDLDLEITYYTTNKDKLKNDHPLEYLSNLDERNKFDLIFKQDGKIEFRIHDDNDEFMVEIFQTFNVTAHDIDVTKNFNAAISTGRAKLARYLLISEIIKTSYNKAVKKYDNKSK